MIDSNALRVFYRFGCVLDCTSADFIMHAFSTKVGMHELILIKNAYKNLLNFNQGI